MLFRSSSEKAASSERTGSSRPALNPKPLVLWCGIVIIVLICAGAVFAGYELQQRDIKEAKRELRALNLLLVEETERSFQSVDLVLRSIQEKFAAEGIESAETFSHKLGDVDTHDVLEARVAGVPQLDGIELVDSTGQVVNMSRLFPPPDINIAETKFYRAMKNRVTDTPYLSEPTRSPGVGRLGILFGRRMAGKSGETIGILAGVLDPAYFQNLFSALQGGKGHGVGLWRTDGTMLVSSPSLNDWPIMFKHLPSRRLLRTGESFTYEMAASQNGPARIVAAMGSRRFPVVLCVSKTRDEVLADWRQFVALLVAGTAICVLAIVALMWLLMRQFTTYEQLTVAVEERGRAVALREQAEAQLRQSQKLESIGQLTGGIAHDFNNLLTAVLGNLELLTRNLDGKDARLYGFAKNAFDAADRGATLTQRLLAFSRRQPLEPRPVDVGVLLGSISEILRRTLGEKIAITTFVAPDVWPALVDQNQLENAVLNIAINARDAMESGGWLRIEARNCRPVCPESSGETGETARNSEFVLLSISDNGKGMAPEVLQRVFEPFFSTKPPGRGTGLGLSQVYGFIKQTGGKIEIRSELGNGTTVLLYLPRAESISATDAPSQKDEADAIERAAGRVLVVEDDAGVRNYSIEILQEVGYVVRDAASPKTALDVLRADPNISLLLADVGLPEMNGRELVSEAQRIRPELRVLYMTGYAEDVVSLENAADPNAAIIIKPFSRLELVTKINMILSPPESSGG